MVKTIEERIDIGEFEFDDAIFENIERNNKEVIKLQAQNRILLGLYNEKEVSKQYDTHRIGYYQKDGIVYYEVLKKDRFGFQ